MAGNDSDEEYTPHPSEHFEGDSDTDDEEVEVREGSENTDADADRIAVNGRLRDAVLDLNQTHSNRVGVNVVMGQPFHHFLFPGDGVVKRFIASVYDNLPKSLQTLLTRSSQPVVAFSTLDIMSSFGIPSAAVCNLTVRQIFAKEGLQALKIYPSKSKFYKDFGNGRFQHNPTTKNGPVLALKGWGKVFGLLTLILYNPGGEGDYQTPYATNIVENGNDLVECADGKRRTKIEALKMMADNVVTLLVYDASDGTSLLSILTNYAEMRAFFPFEFFTPTQLVTSEIVHDSMVTAARGLYVGARGPVSNANEALWLVKTLQPGMLISNFTVAGDAQGRIANINARQQQIHPKKSKCIVSDMKGEDKVKFPSLNKAKGGNGHKDEWAISQTTGKRGQKVTADRIRAESHPLGLMVSLKSNGENVRIRLVSIEDYRDSNVRESK